MQLLALEEIKARRLRVGLALHSPESFFSLTQLAKIRGLGVNLLVEAIEGMAGGVGGQARRVLVLSSSASRSPATSGPYAVGSRGRWFHCLRGRKHNFAVGVSLSFGSRIAIAAIVTRGAVALIGPLSHRPLPFCSGPELHYSNDTSAETLGYLECRITHVGARSQRRLGLMVGEQNGRSEIKYLLGKYHTWADQTPH